MCKRQVLDDGSPALLLSHQEFMVQFSLRSLKEGGRHPAWEAQPLGGSGNQGLHRAMEDVGFHPDSSKQGDALIPNGSA